MVKLFAPAQYWETPEHIIDDMTGGCGPGGFGDWLAPDTNYGLSMFQACRVHDYMYAVGETLAAKEEADRVFLNNMVRLVKDGTRWRWLRQLRLRRAKTYYFFVKTFGGDAFWNGKNRTEEERDVTV